MTIIFFDIGHACREQHSDRTFSSLLRQLFRVKIYCREQSTLFGGLVWIDVFFWFAVWLLHPPELLLDHRTALGDLIYT